MAAQTISDFISTMQDRFSKKLLPHATPLLRLQQLAQKQPPIASGDGTISCKFFRPVWTDATSTLTEGQTPTQRSTLSFESVSVTLQQIGNIAEFSDMATATNIFNLIKTSHTFFAEKFAETVDTKLRNILVNPTDGLTKQYAQGQTSFANLTSSALDVGKAKLHPFDIETAVSKLKLARAPTIKGYYVVVAPPQVISDILTSPIWRNIVSFRPEKVFKGEVGELYGAKLLEATNPFVEKSAEGTFDSSGTAGNQVFSTQVLGGDCFGTVDFNGMKDNSSIAAPKIITLPNADKSDPLNQRTLTGWKALFGGTILNKTWGVNIRSRSAFDTTAKFQDDYYNTLYNAVKQGIIDGSA
jgi:N4-gp56 family major capsid protein